VIVDIVIVVFFFHISFRGVQLQDTAQLRRSAKLGGESQRTITDYDEPVTGEPMMWVIDVGHHCAASGKKYALTTYK
jgi:hypothetical protein